MHFLNDDFNWMLFEMNDWTVINNTSWKGEFNFTSQAWFLLSPQNQEVT